MHGSAPGILLMFQIVKDHDLVGRTIQSKHIISGEDGNDREIIEKEKRKKAESCLAHTLLSQIGCDTCDVCAMEIMYVRCKCD